jgi:DNA-binding MarR family transcriptional regulator
MKIEEEIKSKFSCEFQKAFVNLIYTSNKVQDQSKKVFKALGVTQQQYNVLRILRGKHPETLNPGQIKSVMLDKSPDLTRLIDRLIHKELVDRKNCQENRRKIDISITSQGLDFLEKSDNLIDQNQPFLSENLSKEEANNLSNLLDKARG